MRKEHIKPTNKHGQRHGLCIYYFDNGKLWFKQRYVNGERHGLREGYNVYDVLRSKRYWINGKLVYREWYGGINRIEFNI